MKDSVLTKEERRKVLCVAREQIRSQRKAEQIKKKETKSVILLILSGNVLSSIAVNRNISIIA
ncbi:hypothetical protein SE956_04785 [Escherichia coli]|nr:hypothetical protein [Escherichia coli]